VRALHIVLIARRGQFLTRRGNLERDGASEAARSVLVRTARDEVAGSGRARNFDESDGCGCADARSRRLERMAGIAAESKQFNRGRLRGGVFFGERIHVSRGRLRGADVSSDRVKCTISPSLRLTSGFTYIEVSMNGLDFTSDTVLFTLPIHATYSRYLFTNQSD